MLMKPSYEIQWWKWWGQERCEKIAWNICIVLSRLGQECLEPSFLNAARPWTDFHTLHLVLFSVHLALDAVWFCRTALFKDWRYPQLRPEKPTQGNSCTNQLALHRGACSPLQPKQGYCLNLVPEDEVRGGCWGGWSWVHGSLQGLGSNSATWNPKVEMEDLTSSTCLYRLVSSICKAERNGCHRNRNSVCFSVTDIQEWMAMTHV